MNISTKEAMTDCALIIVGTCISSIAIALIIKFITTFIY